MGKGFDDSKEFKNHAKALCADNGLFVAITRRPKLNVVEHEIFLFYIKEVHKEESFSNGQVFG